MKKMTVKNYASIVKNAPAKVAAKGKVKISGYGGSVGGYSNNNNNNNCHRSSNRQDDRRNDPFFGPSLAQRLRGWAKASTIVTVVLDKFVIRGRIISVDGDGFEMTIVENHRSGGRSGGDRQHHLFQPGSIVFITFKQVNAVAAGPNC
ncbi:hypothetical protein [Paenibacillus radicis (ex Gao et al. 2016)]|uniref:Uncharacterized protein n=1 Tax=Paenibacillus radicis (ex Gao et al. 2016) TaxID=1737354 RepID=A0A917GVJ2_9BACL|nr:hypothetical protein [Paenibacillus radicis (ex Gao et al. 2016)]GGG58157.1 hypothetical protein GCM10010918_09050 [Paenibacillus radicis (ex Gao et al. 2016)]